ncbi:LPXTG cell wall anchor domain-containing protein [Periweissella cryptocerci]|uniref:LPXTG cell wall anchor domain-containing protein n=1 Tax=Periweissella cryptocerci TaxID=2506420 RepID=A0A4V1AIJ9_9LACO|nr:leucine-rich repeat protein [Periweissella cryptocerci]QBO35765.1 LPXTG cell wall anchor domain-containing protein [Periweissella cryptocerci]
MSQNMHHNIYSHFQHTMPASLYRSHTHHWVYTGLATITLLGGLGATPVTLVHAAGVGQSAKIGTNAKSTKNATTTKATAQKTKSPRAIPVSNHTFVVNDFTYTTNSDGTRTITGFNTGNFDYNSWDGILAFPAELSTGANKVTVLGESAFASTKVTAVDFTNLPSLTTLVYGAFMYTSLTSLDLSPLVNLESIGPQVFAAVPSLTSVNFTNLNHLQSLGGGIFSGSAITEIDLTALPALEIIGGPSYSGEHTVDTGAFNNCPQLKTVKIANMESLQTIGRSAFRDCASLTSVELAQLPALTTIDWRAFNSTNITDVILSDLPSLTSVDSGFYGTQSLHQITINNINPTVDIDNAFSGTHNRGIVVPTTLNDVETAKKFATKINEADNNKFTGPDIWYANATVQYTFIDQDNNPITVDGNNKPVTPIALSGPIDTPYTVPDVPEIAGYGEPTLYSGVATGTFTFAPQEVVYKYRATAKPFTVYLVDDAGAELKTQQYSGFADESFDLTPPAVDGYTFKELATRPIVGNDNARALITELTWIRNDALKGTSVKFGANNGTSYKFVYSKNTTTPDPNSDTNNGTNTDGTGTNTSGGSNTGGGAGTNTSGGSNTGGGAGAGTTADKEPTDTAKTPTIANTNPTPLPTSLPGSGGGSPTTRTPTTLTNTPAYGYTPVTTSNSSQKLPQSGNATNHLLPVIGTALLAGILGSLYVFGKKRR